MRLLYLGLSAAAAGIAATAGHAQSMDTAFVRLNAVIDRLDAPHPTPPDLPPGAVQRLRSSVQRLRGAAASIPQGDRENYARSLVAQADLMEAAGRSGDAAGMRSALTAVMEDLDIKARTGPLGAANVVYGHLKVTVRTLRNSRHVKGLVVAATPVALAGQAPLFRFGQMSSPTTRSLPPGHYEFIIKKAGRIVARDRADVGRTSLKAVTLDLDVPPGI